MITLYQKLDLGDCLMGNYFCLHYLHLQYQRILPMFWFPKLFYFELYQPSELMNPFMKIPNHNLQMLFVQDKVF